MRGCGTSRAALAGVELETCRCPPARTLSGETLRERGLSGMPEGLGEILTPLELRDLIEFLARQ